MSFLNKIFTQKKIVVTHNGSFHADDIFACATISLWLEKNNQSFKIIRTRNPEIISKADYVFDVGGIYDSSIHRYDHHQKEGAGVHASGVPYAAFGLAWKHFGMDLCGGDSDVWHYIEHKHVSSLDAIDNGVDVVSPKWESVTPFFGQELFLIYSPTWKEDDAPSRVDEIFKQQVLIASKILSRIITTARDDSEGKNIILQAYNNANNKRIIQVDVPFPRYLLQNTLSSLPEPIYIIYPSADGHSWKIEAVSKDRTTQESRKLFPESWRGFMKSDEKLIRETGVSDIYFTHRSGFYINVKSLESAHVLAEKALLA